MKDSLIDSVQKAAKKLGYDIVPSWRFEKLEQSLLLRELIQKLGITHVLDVGANKGQFARFMRSHVKYEGNIISFEPIHENVSALRSEAAGSSNWRICDFALGEQESQLNINVMKADVFSSFLKPSTQHTQEFIEHNTIDHVESVSVKRLDRTLAALGIDASADAILLKSDTQGFDMQVLNGAGDALESIRAIQVEVSVIGIYDGMPAMADMLDRMKVEGFSLAGLYPVSRTSELAVVEFDAVFKNDRFKVS